MKNKQQKSISLQDAHKLATTGEEIVTGDLRNEMLKGFQTGLEKCISNIKWKDPFYVVAMTKKNQMMKNMINTKFFARHTEPQKDFDTCCYRYIPALEKLEFLWAIPTKAGVDHYATLQGNISREEQQMKEMCQKFLKERNLVKVILPS